MSKINWTVAVALISSILSAVTALVTVIVNRPRRERWTVTQSEHMLIAIDRRTSDGLIFTPGNKREGEFYWRKMHPSLHVLLKDVDARKTSKTSEMNNENQSGQ